MNHAAVGGNGRDADGDDGAAQPRSQDGGDGQGQQNAGKGEQEIDQAHAGVFDDTTEEPGQQTQSRAKDCSDQHGQHTGQQGVATAIQHTGEDIASQLIRSHDVTG